MPPAPAAPAPAPVAPAPAVAAPAAPAPAAPAPAAPAPAVPAPAVPAPAVPAPAAPSPPAAGRAAPSPISASGADPVLTGAVRTTDGWPLPGAAVTVLDAAGGQLGRTVADSTGHFTVPLSAGGPVTVVLAAPGVDPTARSITVDGHGETSLGGVTLGAVGATMLPRPGRWTIDSAHTIIRATARHLAMSRVEGRFTEFAGEIVVRDPVEESSVSITIQAASIDTGNADRDAHLRSPDFLDVERFGELTFHSTTLRPTASGRWEAAGVLTIRDIPRDVVLDIDYLGTGPDPWGGTRTAFAAVTELARRDYEMNWNMGLPTGLVLVGPTLRVELDVQAVLQEPGS